jgi:hypothetical protein
VGLDFYCELVENDALSWPPFYVQAKSTQYFDDDWGCSISKTTINYWLNQPLPVFLIVFDEVNKKCYWMSIEDRRYDLYKKMATDSDTIYIQMDRSHTLFDDRDSNKEFIDKVKDDFHSVLAWQGRPRMRGDGYVKQVPPPPRSQIELERNIANIQMNMYSLVQYYINVDLGKAYFYCKFLTELDTSHYNQFVWFARINKKMGSIEETKKAYRSALEICERDKKWPTESMEKLKSAIRQELDALQ